MSTRRRIAVLSTGRQDYGIVRSTCLALRSDSRFELTLLVAGMHLSPAHGLPVSEIDADGIPIHSKLDTFRARPEEESAATIEALVPVLQDLEPDALLVAGDRTETAAGVLAATIARVPVIHLHGGEETEGAIDNALRHAITKMSHLHLVSNEVHARRVRQMGEPPATIVVVGAPGLDNLRRPDLPSRADLERHLGISLKVPVVLVTHHPATLGGDPQAEASALVDAMSSIDATWVITLPNSDAGAIAIRKAFVAFASTRPSRAVAVESLGAARYAAMLRIADAMLGNSSSGIIEAPVFALPAVNVGDRQKGRLRSANVLDVPAARAQITASLARALDPAFRRSLDPRESPYGDGKSAARILEALAAWDIPQPPRKTFAEIALTGGR